MSTFSFTPLYLSLLLATSFLCSLAALAAPELKHGADKDVGVKAVKRSTEKPIKRVVGKTLNSVALDIDEYGSVYVVETTRYVGNADIDNRGNRIREDGTQKVTTLAEREAFLRHLHKIGNLKPRNQTLDEFLTGKKEKIWKFTDPEGDGTYDRKLFYEGFNTVNSGIAAGVVARNGKVHVTAEPEFWVFDDVDNKAANGKVLHTGFQVKVGWYGHDLHGLVYGNDGKIYFSIGDKGWHVTTADGTVHANDNTGGVFRCNPDGSDFEVFAEGLRNPQEIAFDNYGNLFTGDNNCDSGDKARLVYITEGSDSGWRFSTQSFHQRGPWLREKTWELRRKKDDPTQPAWITPPVAYIGSGPSGMTFYPGIGMPPGYENHFLICDYRGGGGNLDSFTVEPTGAGFKMIDFHRVLAGPANTSVRVGYDGKLYLTDWGGGWRMSDRGNLFTLHYKSQIDKPEIAALAKLSKEDFSSKSSKELATLLAHADTRIRQRAHYALASKSDVASVAAMVIRQPQHRFAPLHATWALQMAGRNSDSARAELVNALGAANLHVRAIAARALGDLDHKPAAKNLMALTKDGSPRVRFFALKALGKLGHAAAISEVTRILAENDNDDAFMRDACAFTLEHLHKVDQAGVRQLLDHESPVVRLGAVLGLRRAGDDHLAKALSDKDRLVAVEAARAIYDKRMIHAFPELAAMLRPDLPQELRIDPVIRRALHANLRIGDEAAVNRIMAYVTNNRIHHKEREATFNLLANWDNPSARDGVWGAWWPIERKEQGVVKKAVAANASTFLPKLQGKLIGMGYQLARKSGVKIPNEAYVAALRDNHADFGLRREALAALIKTDQRATAIELALKANHDELKERAVDHLLQDKPEKAFAQLDGFLKSNSLRLKQYAVRTLPKIKHPAATNKLTELTKQLIAGTLASDLMLEVHEAAKSVADSPSAALLPEYESNLAAAAPAQKYAFALKGGNKDRGHQVFHKHAAAQCVRCHKVGRHGGDVGPNLQKIGKQRDPEYLLRAIVDPAAEIATGYGMITVTQKDGTTVSGALVKETDTELHLRPEPKKTTIIKRSEVASQTEPVTGMPPMGVLLKPNELRDLMAYLLTLKR